MVLIMTLLILVAMLLVSTALLRSSDTSIQVVNNLSFRQAAEAPANMAVEHVVQDMLNAETRPAYFSDHWRNTDSPEGIPATLLRNGVQPGEGTMEVSDMSVRFVAERMCADPNAGLTPANCMLSNGGGMGTVPVHTDGEYRTGSGAGSPIVRVSIRVDGVRNTAVFAQAFIN
ncbi:MAG: hypothetical protein FWC35_07095 [Proteobacteria bacterium]|nr:hypothetical protein [Pseudomonadota bacterium]